MSDTSDPTVVEPYGSAPKPDNANDAKDPPDKPNDPTGKELTQPPDTEGG